MLTAVSKVNTPPEGAVQSYHTEAPPSLPAWLGSFGCFVAPTLLPKIVPPDPVMTSALLNMSLVTGGVTVKSVKLSTEPCGVVMLIMFGPTVTAGGTVTCTRTPETTVKTGALITFPLWSSKTIESTRFRLVPLIVTTVPTGPMFGLKLMIEGCPLPTPPSTEINMPTSGAPRPVTLS